MANEIKINLSLSVNKNGAKSERQESKSIDMTGNAYHSGVQIIAAAREDVLCGADLAERTAQIKAC